MAATLIMTRDEQAERSIIDALASLDNADQATAHLTNFDVDCALFAAREAVNRALAALAQLQQEQAQPVTYRLAA